MSSTETHSWNECKRGQWSPEVRGEGVPAVSSRLPSAGPAPGENTSFHLININCRAPGFRTWVSIFVLLGGGCFSP